MTAIYDFMSLARDQFYALADAVRKQSDNPEPSPSIVFPNDQGGKSILATSNVFFPATAADKYLDSIDRQRIDALHVAAVAQARSEGIAGVVGAKLDDLRCAHIAYVQAAQDAAECGKRNIGDLPAGAAVMANWAEAFDSLTAWAETDSPRRQLVVEPDNASGPWSEPDSPARWAKKFKCSAKTFVRHVESRAILAKKLSDKSYQVALSDIPAGQK
jgi:hypothetical protein